VEARAVGAEASSDPSRTSAATGAEGCGVSATPAGSRCAPARRVLAVAHVVAPAVADEQRTLCGLDIDDAGELRTPLDRDTDRLCPACAGTTPDQLDLFGGPA